MKLKILISCAARGQHCEAGTVVEVDDASAAILIAQRQAVKYVEPPPAAADNPDLRSPLSDLPPRETASLNLGGETAHVPVAPAPRARKRPAFPKPL